MPARKDYVSSYNVDTPGQCVNPIRDKMLVCDFLCMCLRERVCVCVCCVDGCICACVYVFVWELTLYMYAQVSAHK